MAVASRHSARTTQATPRREKDCMDCAAPETLTDPDGWVDGGTWFIVRGGSMAPAIFNQGDRRHSALPPPRLTNEIPPSLGRELVSIHAPARHHHAGRRAR